MSIIDPVLQDKSKPATQRTAATSSTEVSGVLSPQQALERAVESHNLVSATIQPTSFGKILACTVCGAFAWKNRGALQDPCPRRPATQGFRDQLRRLNAFQFPGTNGAAGKAKAAISAHQAPSAEELAWLSRHEQERQTQECKAAKVKQKMARAEAWGTQSTPSCSGQLRRHVILKEFGISTAADLEAWVGLNKSEPDSDPESEDEW